MSSPDRRAEPGSTNVSPVMIPLLFLGLMVGFFAGYFFLGWGVLAVVAVLAIAFSMVLRGKSRDGATGAVTGVVLGYGGFLLLLLFRGLM